MNKDNCCTVSCENPLDKQYWDAQYHAKNTAWDIGSVSPPIQSYIDTIEDKSIRILIPGCGNSYEAEYLLQKGFVNVTVIDIAPKLIENLRNKFDKNPNITIVLGDFFEHQGEYDLIIEQTFFCALPPFMRQKYVWKMHQLLSQKGVLAGLLFNTTFEVSPPFGGSKAEYELLFKSAFRLLHMDLCTNSIAKRVNSELFIELKKNNTISVALYSFEGITCTDCMQSITTTLSKLDGVLNASISSNFSELLIVSNSKMALAKLQNAVSYDAKYKISEIGN